MAFEQIASFNIYEFEQEEIEETKQIAGEDGVVSEVTTLVQPYIYLNFELRVFQQRNNNNTSDFKAEIWGHARAGEKGSGFVYSISKGGYGGSNKANYMPVINGFSAGAYSFNDIDRRTIKAGANESIRLRVLDTTDTSRTDGSKYNLDYNLGGPSLNYVCGGHNLDGSFKHLQYRTSGSGTYAKYFEDIFVNPNITGYFHYTDTNNSGQSFSWKAENNISLNEYILPIDRYTYPITADNFTDNGDPALSYTIVTGKTGYSYIHTNGMERAYFREDNIESLEVALSFDGVTPDIAYRAIPISDTHYAFDLTEEEREMLRIKAQGSPNVPIYYLVKTVRSATTEDGAWESVALVSATERVLTIVGCEPQLSPTVRDIHGRANYLTGNENKFIKYVSIAEFTTGAVASKHATIVNQSVINGSQTVENLSSGTIEGVDSNTFYFAATDSRGLTARDAIVVDLVPYIKLTARVSKASLNTDGELSFTITGNYFNGSFGAVNNSLEFEYGIREENGDINWFIFEGEPSFNGNTYTINHSITGLNYRNAFTIIVNVIDEITSIQTEPKTVVAIPVFDWSANDFKHNTNVAFANNKSINGIKTNGAEVSIFEPCNADNSTVLNYSGFADRDRDTAIFGNTIKLISNNPVEINGKNYGENRVLWSGVSHMNGNQSITLNEAVSEQTNGIVLVFSLYRNNAAEDVSINTAFISKQQVALLSGAPHSFFMLVNAGFSILGAKYLYIDDNTIRGHEGNTSSGSNNGITFNNSNYVLRYVIGV
jgi:hypothetical protein